MQPELSSQLVPTRLKVLFVLQVIFILASSLTLGVIGFALTNKLRAYRAIESKQAALVDNVTTLIREKNDLENEKTKLAAETQALAQRSSQVAAALAVAEGSNGSALQAVILPNNSSDAMRALASKIRPYAKFERVGPKSYKGTVLTEFRLGVTLPEGIPNQFSKVTYLFNPEHYKVNPSIESTNVSNAFEITTKVWGCSGTVRIRLQVASAKDPIEVVFDWCKAANWDAPDLAQAR